MAWGWMLESLEGSTNAAAGKPMTTGWHASCCFCADRNDTRMPAPEFIPYRWQYGWQKYVAVTCAA